MNNKRNKLFKRVAIAALLMTSAGVFLFFTGPEASAQSNTFGINEFAETTVLADTDIRVIIARIIRAALGLLGILAVSIILYAGFVIMTSGGNEEKVTQGKKILINAVIGLAIILSALAITQFILSALTGSGGSGRTGGPGGAPEFQTFTGSGALGHIVKDHFPFRDQTDVYRNTWISVTFREPINPATIIENTNGTCWGEDGARIADPLICDPENDGELNFPAYYGDCITPPAGTDFDWRAHCDQMKIGAIEIYHSAEAETDPLPLVAASAMTVYEDGEENNAYTFTFRPHELLGDGVEDTWYTANLTNNIKKPNGDDVFQGADSHYDWEFQVNTTVDLDPPSVASVSPEAGEAVARNKIVKITFNEAVNPIMVQGIVNNTAGDSFTNIIFNNTEVEGEWKISNGYRTVEFIPSIPCGTNSCGSTVYCLAIDCETNDSECTADYKSLARTAALIDPVASWTALPPINGVIDMVGNALDGDKDGARDGKPAMPGDPTVFAEGASAEEKPDNYYWNFTVENRIELTPPYVHQVSPSVDESYVIGQKELSITFDSVMTYYTLSDIFLEEYPARAEIPESGGKHLPDIWYRPLSEDMEIAITADPVDVTKVNINHREFGPNGMDLFYFTSIPSSVENDYQNCMYPGRGPSDNPGNRCVYTEADDGTQNAIGCLPGVFSFTGEYFNVDTGCAHSDPVEPDLADTLENCQNNLRSISNY